MPLKGEGLREMVHLQRKMNQLFEEMLQPGQTPQAMPEYTWAPPADVFEDKKSYFVELELPGVWIEDVNVVCEGNILRVSGERRPALELTRESVQRMERYFGPFLREFAFPEPIDADHVSASLKDGVLVVSVARKGRARSVKVK